MLERLQKILSARGIASRRKAEEYIERGLVKVNGIVATLGQKADPDKDTIEVDGKVIEERKEMLYYALYKPVGVETTNVETKEGGTRIAKSVRDILPKELQGKVFPVGRLDKDSEGLLLLTNDGVLAYRLTHPSFDHEKEYEVELKEAIFDGALMKLERGVKLEGEATKPAEIHRIDNRTFRIILTEGRYRQIRRMCQKVGSEVVRLKRVRVGSFAGPLPKPGGIRPLTHEEKAALLASVGLS